MKQECELYLAPKTPRATNMMDVKLTVVREIVINDKRDLKQIQTDSSQKSKMSSIMQQRA